MLKAPLRGNGPLRCGLFGSDVEGVCDAMNPLAIILFTCTTSVIFALVTLVRASEKIGFMVIHGDGILIKALLAAPKC